MKPYRQHDEIYVPVFVDGELAAMAVNSDHVQFITMSVDAGDLPDYRREPKLVVCTRRTMYIPGIREPFIDVFTDTASEAPLLERIYAAIALCETLQGLWRIAQQQKVAATGA